MVVGCNLRTIVCGALACVLVLVAIQVGAQSQATTGVIEGRVVDGDGQPLPGAAASLLNTGTNFEKTLVTDVRGRFRAMLLPLGTYRATVSMDGFATQVQEEIELRVGQTITLGFTLSPAKFEGEIVVSAGAPLIEVSRTDNAVGISEAAMAGLPNNGRNFLSFMNLTPGVSIVQGPDGDEISINGQRGIQNNISVDGADFNNPFFGEQRGGQRPSFTFNLDAVQELVVVADGAPAEFGRSSAGFVNAVTKSGTNEFHGTAHVFFKNDSMSTSAERANGSREPKYDSEQSQVGFTFGGPLQQDRLFFFAAFDMQRGESTKQNDPDRIEQRVVDAFATLGSPDENGPITRTNDAEVFLGKIDWHAEDRHLATGRVSYTNSVQKNGTFDVDSWGRSANATEKDSSYSFSGSLVSTVGETQLNELRFQYARESRPRPYDGPTFTGTDRPLPDTAFDFDHGYRFGMPFFIPVKYHDTRWQMNDNYSWITRDHTFKTGVEWNQTAAFQTFVGFANGRFIFDSTDGFLNYLENPSYVECSDGSSSPDGVCPEGTSIVGPVLLYLQQAGVGGISVEDAGTQTIVQNELAAFFQDLWQPLPNLSVSLGLRWEAQYQPDPRTSPNDVFFADFIGQTRDGQRFPSNGKIPSDASMWQPRLGFSWDPFNDGKTVIRANAGLYYARIPGLMLASTRSTNGSIGQNLFRSSELGPILGPPPAYDELIPTDAAGVPFHPEVYVFDEDFQNPRTTSAGFAVEHEVRDGLAAVLKYSWAETKHLTRMLDLNDPLLGSPWGTGLGDDGSNGIGTLWTVSSTASSMYKGWTLGLKGRITDRLHLQTYYTYSKDKSDDDNERDPFTLRYARITDLDKEWSWSDRDQRHRVNAWMLWNGPWGLDLNVRYSYRSPQPKSITETGADAGTPQGRINADGTVTRRNLGRKDNQFSSIDLRLSKTFTLSDYDLEAIVEVFNLANSRNQRTPEVTNLIFNFDGTVQSGLGDPRQVQVGMRMSW